MNASCFCASTLRSQIHKAEISRRLDQYFEYGTCIAGRPDEFRQKEKGLDLPPNSSSFRVFRVKKNYAENRTLSLAWNFDPKFDRDRRLDLSLPLTGTDSSALRSLVVRGRHGNSCGGFHRVRGCEEP